MSSGIEPSETAYVRRIYYINKDFQKRFIIEYVALLFLGIILANGMLYILLNKGIDKAFYRAHIGIATTGDVVRSPLVLTSIAVVFISIAAVLISTLLNSWKINSLLHCLAEGMDGIKNGDLTVEIKVCRNNLVKVSDSFNRAVRQLNRRIASIKDEMTRLEEAAADIEEDKADNLDRLLSATESLERHLSAFKLRQ